MIAYAIGWVGSDHAIPILIKALESREDNHLRSEAASALGRLKAKAAFSLLRDIIRDPREDSNVRANACMALGYMAHESARDVLAAALSDPDPFVAATAKASLALLRDDE